MEFVSGMIYEYYHVCKRKTWYAANGISMEEENESVQIGKLIDETAYNRERKHILVDVRACIDFLKDKTIYEIKKSSAEKQASIAQIKYYLYILWENSVEATGELRIPKENLIEKVTLAENDVAEIEKALSDILTLTAESKVPPVENKPICKKCAYYELCYS